MKRESKPRRLTAAFVKAVKAPDRYGDGPGGFGLFLRVHRAAGGRITKSWCQRVRPPGRKPTNVGLGSYPVVSLAEARAKALANRRTIEQGRDPRDAGVPTFEQAAARVIAQRAKGWKQGTTLRQQWEASLRTYAFPVVGQKRVNEVTRADVLGIVEPIWTAKPSAARLALQRVRLVLRWAVAAGHVGRTVADDSIEAGLSRQNGPKRHHRALSPGDVPGALATVRASTAPLATRLAVEMAVLTAARASEVRGMTWDEIDMKAGVWTIPAARMKAKREHRVPLSARALDVLREARRLPHSTRAGVVFPGALSGKMLSPPVMGALLKRLGIPSTLHGLARASFRMWSAEEGEDRQAAEAALAHVVKGVEGRIQPDDPTQAAGRTNGAVGTTLCGGHGGLTQSVVVH